MTESGPILQIENLSVSYGDVFAVRDVSFAVYPGEVVALVGRSGAGKSSIIAAIMDMLPAHAERSGKVAVSGRILTESVDGKWRNHVVALIPQNPFSWFNPMIRVQKQMAEVVRTGGKMKRSLLPSRVQELLQIVGLDDVMRVLSSRPEALSGGMRQRVAMAAAIAHKPPLLLADEPTSALDAASQSQILDLLAACRERQQAILLVSHEAAVVKQLADRVLHIEDGCLVESPVDSSSRLSERDPVTSDRSVLSCEGISVRYSAHCVVDDFSLSVKTGETVAIVGESGSGKSSLCHVFGGLLRPSSGTVHINDALVSSLSREERARHLRLMFQDVRGSIDERLSVWRSIALALRGSDMSDVEVRDRVFWACEVAELDDSLLERKPGELSGGEVQRAVLARAIAPRTPLLFLDEPFSSLDIQTRNAVVQRLIAMQQEFSTCIVAVLHNEDVVHDFAHRVVTLEKRNGDSVP